MRYVEPFVGGGAVFFDLKGTTPFLRWVGGKRKLLGEVMKWLHLTGCPQRWDAATYEPACQCLSFNDYLLADANPDLVAAYTTVQREVEGLCAHLKTWPPTVAQHAELRAWNPQFEVLRGARMIWLNLYSHGGLWRCNQRGLFNVPPQPDRFTSINLDTVAAQLCEASKALQGVSIACQDFSTTLSQCGEGDVAYCDPPYLPDDTSRFVGYTRKEETSRQLHERLAAGILAAVQRGARVVMSNSPAAMPLYCRAFLSASDVLVKYDTVSTQRSIGVGKGDAVKRRQDEIIVTVSRL